MTGGRTGEDSAATAHVLVVEDDDAVRAMLVEYLSENGFSVAEAMNGAGLRAAVALRVPDVVLLDVRLGGEDGLALARWLRERHALGIIMVTGAGSVVDRVVGLEVGADDYVAKPFDPRELLARVKSVLRRVRAGAGAGAAPAAQDFVAVGAFRLDRAAHRLLDASGEEVPLTAMEFDLLRVFTEHPNQVLSRDRLLTLTRNREWDPFDRSVDIRIARLRKKIEADPARPQLLRTVRGAGYLYAPRKEPA